ncbi:MAG: cryptochrome/photolyase family protein, partial [Ilumatobacteraceae bacterium]
MTATGRRSVWILADQCHPELAHLRGTSPDETDVLFVVALDKLRAAPWHRQRLHLILTTMRRFAVELTGVGYRVDWRVASSMAAGVDAHIAAFAPERLRVMQSSNRAGASLIDRLAQRHGDRIDVVPDDRFLCSVEEFCAWAAANQRRDGSLLMEDFYRWQRRRLGILVDA